MEWGRMEVHFRLLVATAANTLMLGESESDFNLLRKRSQFSAPSTRGSMSMVGHSEDALTRIRNIEMIELGRFVLLLKCSVANRYSNLANYSHFYSIFQA